VNSYLGELYVPKFKVLIIEKFRGVYKSSKHKI